jgi:hypothetical protein
MKLTEAHARFKATIRALRKQNMPYFSIKEIFENAAEELVTEENTGKQEMS